MKLYIPVHTIGTQTITSVILSLLLLPEDFGYLGMELVFKGLVAIFNERGTCSAIIQNFGLYNR